MKFIALKTNVKKIVLTAIGLIGGGYAIYKSINKEPSKYSLEWIKGLSDDQWATECEIVQNQFRNPELDTAFRENCHRILDLFDKVKSARDWAGKHRKVQFTIVNMDLGCINQINQNLISNSVRTGFRFFVKSCPCFFDFTSSIHIQK